jgi:hypothetical protein
VAGLSAGYALCHILSQMKADLGTVATIVSAMATTVGIFFIWYQIRRAAKTAKATFIFQLESEFVEHHKTTFQLIETSHGSIPAEKQADIELYLDFFSTLESFRQHKFLTIEEIDQLYAYRFFAVLSEMQVMQMVNDKEPYWSALLLLASHWYRHRKKRSAPVKGEGPAFRRFLGIDAA